MIFLLFTNQIIGLLERVLDKGLEMFLEATLENSLFYMKFIMSDVQKIKHKLQDIINSPVNQTISNFQDALLHLQVPQHQSQSQPNESKMLGTELIIKSDFMTNVSLEKSKYIKKNSLTDAIKYFNDAIRTSNEAMALKSTSLENYLLCMQIRFLCQLFSENFHGARMSIRSKLKEFVKRPDVNAIYCHLYFDGADWNDREMKIAYVIFKMFEKLEKLKIIDADFITDELYTIVCRSNYHPLEQLTMRINITNPQIKLKSFGDKVVDYGTQIGIGLVTVPCGIAFGALRSALSIGLSPILIPFAIGMSIFGARSREECKERILGAMEQHLKYNIGGIVTTPSGAIALFMDNYVGVKGFFRENTPPPDLEIGQNEDLI